MKPSLRLPSIVSQLCLVSAGGWTVATAVAITAFAGQAKAPPDAICPTCEVLHPVVEALGVVAVGVSLVAFAGSVAGLLRRNGLTPVARAGLWLLLAGTPLLLLLGTGVALIVPGLALLALGLRGTPLSPFLPAAMLAAFAAALVVGAPLDDTRDPSAPRLLATGAIVSVVGIAWAWLGQQVRRTGFPELPVDDGRSSGYRGSGRRDRGA